MHPVHWRLIQDEAGGAAWNMALDEALFESVAANAAPPVIRLYQWENPSVSLGRFQSLERTLAPIREDLPAAVSMVRRITGGRGILHGDDLTVSLAAPVAALGLSNEIDLLSLYEALASGFVRAFRQLGIDAAMGHCARGKTYDVRGDCFATISQADLVDVATGRKLLGAALHRRADWFLQQVSLPLHQRETRDSYFRLRASLFRGAVSEAPGSEFPDLSPSVVRSAIATGLAEALGGKLLLGAATSQEVALAEQLCRERYADSEWTAGKRKSLTAVAGN